MSELTPTQIVSWFRTQARIFDEMANTVEATFTASPLSKHPEGPNLPGLKLPTPPTAEALRTALALKSMRVSEAAKHFHVHDGAIIKIISDKSNGFSIGNRGWINDDQALLE